jgi:hypothetical protein
MRATHNPFYFRVPFQTYMTALQRATPSLSLEKLLAKAYGQLALELIRKGECWSYASERLGDDCLDLGRANQRHFWEAYQAYCRDYKPLGEHDKAARQGHDFEQRRRHLSFGLDGNVHRLSLTARATDRKALTLMSGPR